MTKKRRRHTPEQIIRKLAEGHKELAAGKELDEVCRHLEIAKPDCASSSGRSRGVDRWRILHTRRDIPSVFASDTDA